LILGIKLRETTIANISNHFVRTAFLILEALSLLMGGGMLLAYRNVSRELALAKLKSDFVSNVSHELRTLLASNHAISLHLAQSGAPEISRSVPNSAKILPVSPVGSIAEIILHESELFIDLPPCPPGAYEEGP
jgi:signal transduction histidine kinase